MIGLSIGIALMGAIVSARWPGGLAGAATDPRAFVDGLSVAFGVNGAIALVAAVIAALTIAGGRPEGARPSAGRERREHDAVDAVRLARLEAR